VMQPMHAAELLHLVVKVVSEPFGPKQSVTSLEPYGNTGWLQRASSDCFCVCCALSCPEARLQRHKNRSTEHCPVRQQSFEVQPSIVRLRQGDDLGRGRRLLTGTGLVYMFTVLAAWGGFCHSTAVFRDPSNCPYEGSLTIYRSPAISWPDFARRTV